MYENKAFTLSEVLITLAVIGVVAAIVIPSVYQQTNSAEIKVQWKKMYGDLSNATRLILINNGGTIKNLCNDSDCLTNLYAPYLNVTKSCGSGGTITGNCWTSFKPDPSAAYALTVVGPPINTNPGMTLSNGQLIEFNFLSSNCSDTSNGLSDCAEIDVDVNGFKNPNVEGVDIFKIHLQENGIKPFGITQDGITSCTSSGGDACAAKYLLN